jgi:hypothetical protein
MFTYASLFTGIGGRKYFTLVRFSSIIILNTEDNMTRKQQDKRAAEMYELYQQGYSLSEIGKAYGVTRQSVYGIFAGRGYAMREKKRLPYMVWNGNKYTLTTGGYYRRTDGDRELLHRDMWKLEHGSIPDGHEIHHKDGDKTNNVIENFECLLTEDHTRLHNPQQSIQERYCLYCGKQLVRRTTNPKDPETPAELAKRRYCDATCKANHFEGKPRGWKPDVDSY